jgi:hypothetical protein
MGETLNAIARVIDKGRAVYRSYRSVASANRRRSTAAIPDFQIDRPNYRPLSCDKTAAATVLNKRISIRTGTNYAVTGRTLKDIRPTYRHVTKKGPARHTSACFVPVRLRHSNS